MGYTQGEERPYALRSAPGAKVVIVTPTERTKRRLVDGGPKTPDPKTHDADVFAGCERAIALAVASVEGYEHRGRAIRTAADLIEYAEPAVIIELGAEILTEASLSAEERRFLGGPSDSSGGAESTSTAHAASVAAPAT